MRVSQKIAIYDEAGRILGLRRSHTDTVRPLTWDLPGGEVEERENLELSARREIREETGIEVDALNVADAYGSVSLDGNYWVVIFWTATTRSADISLSHEHDLFEWMTIDEFLLRESSDKIRYFLQKS